MKISILSLGGTISMLPNDKGLDCALDAKALANSVNLPDYELQAITLAALASPSLEFKHAKMILQAAYEQEALGSKGIVITQGTDTLEEMSYLISLLYQGNLPLIFTGAMRSSSELSSDAAANLHASIKAAASEIKGVYLCFNDELFLPKFVHKSNTFSLQTFSSQTFAATAIFSEGEWRFLKALSANCQKPLGLNPECLDAKVGIYTCALSDGAEYLKALATEAFCLDGLIVNGFGSAHVHSEHVSLLAQIAQKIPVIMCSRCGSGFVGHKTYAYKGSEIDLQNHNIIMANSLSALKARLLLCVLLSSGYKDIKQAFSEFS